MSMRCNRVGRPGSAEGWLPVTEETSDEVPAAAALTIRPVCTDAGQRAAEAALIASLAPTDVARWWNPDQPQELAYRAYASSLLDVVMRDGVAYTIAVPSDLSGRVLGVALWMPYDPGPPRPGPGPSTGGWLLDPPGEHLARPFGGDAFDRVGVMGQALSAHNLRSQPHHRLIYLGVRPEDQRQGLGAALLNHHLAHLDSIRMPVHLHALGVEAWQFFNHRGTFATLDRFLVGAGGPLVYPMWREPQ